MLPGGIIFFDDYNATRFPGATKAIDDILGKDSIKKIKTYQGYWVKKRRNF